MYAMKNAERLYALPFALLMLLLFVYYAWSGILFSPPSHIHAWTQSDRWALAWGYADEGGANFFLPRTYNLATKDGITGVDLPLHEYIIGWLMWLFGTREAWLFRGYMFFWLVVGNAYLFRLAWRYCSNAWAALLLPLWVSTMPIMLYYQAGFLPSLSAWSAMWVGNFYLLRYVDQAERRDGARAIFWLTLAAMLRLPFVLYTLAAAIMLLLHWWRRGAADKRLLLYGVAAAAAVGTWLWYKNYLSQQYGTQFLTRLMPPQSWEEFRSLWALVRERWTAQILWRGQYAFVALLFLPLLLSLWRSRSAALWAMFLFTSAAAALYFLLMMRQFVDHEYYFIDSLFVPLTWLLLLAARATLGDAAFLRHWAARLVWAVLWLAALAGGLRHSLAVQQQKYAFALWDGGEATRKNFEGAAAWLDTVGIPRSARIVVVDAYSTNAPLLAMQRRGWTVLDTYDENIEKALALPADYFIFQDQFTPADAYARFSPRLRRLAGNGRLSLYALRPTKAASSDVFEFLGVDTVHCLKAAASIDAPDLQGEFSPAIELDAQPLRRVLVQVQAQHRADLHLVAHLSDATNEKVLYYWEHRLPASDTLRDYYCVFSLPAHRSASPQRLRIYLWRRDAGAVRYERLHLWGD